MSDGEKLTQAEIDMLLRGDTHSLTAEQIDAVGEVGNISLGSASTPMSQLLQQPVTITTPKVSVRLIEEMEFDFRGPFLVISIEYTEGLKGNNVLVVQGDDAKKIANLMLGGDGTDLSGELDELHLSAVGEIMNQMMGSAATSMSAIFETSVNISPPVVQVQQTAEHGIGLSGWFIVVEFQLAVGNLIDSTLLQFIPFDFGVDMINRLLQPLKAAESSMSKPVEMATAKQPVPQQTAERPLPKDGLEASERPVRIPAFESFDGHVSAKVSPRNLDILLDVELNVHVELGNIRKRIREILELTTGSIVELDKLAGEPVDVYINNQHIGFGEVVVIDEKFGVRITEIVSPEERIKRFR